MDDDGIGDDPYIIDEENMDNYPLMEPWIPIIKQTDLNSDGAVNIIDTSIVAKAFGSRPEDPNWNEAADLDNNELVNILDISIVAKDYGKTV